MGFDDIRSTHLTKARRTPRGERQLRAVWFTELLLGGQAPHDDELEAGVRAGLERINQLTEAANEDR